jgi:T5orf172 domain
MASTSLINVSNILNNNKIDDRLYELLEINMNTEDQKLFIKSFYLYLEHDNKEDIYVINLNDIYEWVGFSRKDNAKTLLIKNFKKDKDYIINGNNQSCEKYVPAIAGATDNSNKIGKFKFNEIIMLNINTFKKFCMKASTKRADEICDYYLRMENIYHQYIKEKITETNNRLIEIENNKEIDTLKFKNEQNLRDYENQSGAYIFIIEPSKDEEYIYCNFGSTSNITERMKDHRSDFKKINKKVYLYLFYPTVHYLKAEQKIKNEVFIIKHKINYNNHIEMFAIKNENDPYNLVNKVFKSIFTVFNQQFNEDNILELEKEKTRQVESNNKTKQLEIELKKEELKVKEEEEKTKQTLGIEEEKTKQYELKLKEREVELKKEKEKTKQLELEVELKKLEIVSKSNGKLLKPKPAEQDDIVENRRGSSKYNGVRKASRGTMFEASISKDRIRYQLGSYETQQIAAYAYNCKALELYDDTFVKLNNVSKPDKYEWNPKISRLVIL